MLVLVLYVFFRVVIIALFLAALKYIELMLYGGLRLRTLGPAVRGRLRGVTVGLVVVHGCAHARQQVQCATGPLRRTGRVAAERVLDMLLLSSAWRQAQLLPAAVLPPPPPQVHIAMADI